jgi:hypothetical protein
VILLNIFFECRQNFQLHNVIVCDFLMQEKLPISWHLGVQTGSNKVVNKGMDCPVCCMNI